MDTSRRDLPTTTEELPTTKPVLRRKKPTKRILQAWLKPLYTTLMSWLMRRNWTKQSCLPHEKWWSLDFKTHLSPTILSVVACDTNNHSPSEGLVTNKIQGLKGYLIQMDSTCELFAPWNMRVAIMFAFITNTHTHIQTHLLLCHWSGPRLKESAASHVHVLIVQMENVTLWDCFYAYRGPLNGGTSHCSLDVTVIYWCDCECTFCLGISVCFLFVPYILLTTPSLSVWASNC